jgi:type III pantothenate kinase
MNLIIDNGNSLTKIALFERDYLVHVNIIEKLDEGVFNSLLKKYSAKKTIVSSVGNFPSELIEFLSKKTKLHQFSHQTKIPIINKYKTPETLGLDRLAVAIGAYVLYPNSNCLIIDAGTCITYEFINSKKEYFGGAISPGIKMRFEALHTFTAKLPLVRFDDHFSKLTGQNTVESILSGVQNGVIEEMKGMINLYREQHNDVKILMCGGAGDFFDTHLKSSIFAEPNLVLIGLNAVLNDIDDLE